MDRVDDNSRRIKMKNNKIIPTDREGRGDTHTLSAYETVVGTLTVLPTQSP